VDPAAAGADATPTATDGIATDGSAAGAPSAAPAEGVGNPAQGPGTQAGAAGPTQVLLSLPRDTGPATTDHFTVSGSWTLAWAFSCVNYGGAGSFSATVYQGDGTPTGETPASGQGVGQKGVARFNGPGDRYLVVDSPCAWALRVNG